MAWMQIEIVSPNLYAITLLLTDCSSTAVVLMQYHTIEMYLYDFILLKPPSLTMASNQDFQLLELLHACLQASKSFFDLFFSIPVTSYHCIPVHTFKSLTRSLIILQKLSVLEHPDWSLAYVRESVNFMDVLDILAERLAQVRSAICFDQEISDEIDMFSRAATKISCVKSFCEGKMPFEASGHDPQNWDPEVLRTVQSMDFVDELWLKDIMGPWGDDQFIATL